MSLRPDLDRGGVLLVASRAAIFLGTAGSTLVLARVLGPGEFGIVASATAITSILLVFGSFGLDQLYLVGEIDRHALRVRSTQIFVVAAALATLGALAWPSVATTTRACVALIGVATALDYLKLPYLLEPQRRLDFGRRARRETVLRLGIAGAAVAGALLRQSPVTVGAAILLASVALLAPARALPRLDRHQPVSSLPEMLRRGMPFAVSGALYTLYFQIDMALLASLSSSEAVAQYRAAYNFLAAAVVLAVVLNNEIMRPRLYRLAIDGREFAAILRSSAVLSAGVGAACAVVTVGLGPAAVSLAYGDAYRPAGTLVRILGLAILPHFFNSWAGNALVARRHVRLVVLLQAALVAVNVAGNLVLIPSRGPTGAAIMTVVTEWAGAVLYGWVLWRAARSRSRRGDRLHHEALPDQQP